MRLRWVSGDKEPQQVGYGDGKSETSQVITFSADDMCSELRCIVPSPAKDFGWHDPGYIHIAVNSGLQPSTSFNDAVGWSGETEFRTPPAGGSDELKFLVFGDMGKAPLDDSAEHYIQPGSISVIKAMTEEVESGNVDFIFHIGDISYATGFLVEWDFFLHLITPLASQVTYMTAIGNHDRVVVPRSRLGRGMWSPLLDLFSNAKTRERQAMRTCSVYNSECLAMPTKDGNGIDTYDNSNYTAPEQAIVGMAGFSLDKFSDDDELSLEADTKHPPFQV
ncbi:Detected protein of confused Function [Hibiscus syriacus]|uniref:Purple acid phosphatase n=1 Tax=Hibiscus syriacus TaxID=106335 RepID=A0A6A2Z059_HIBSY|nr:Detected protein of confused Function [Hibiscus syriacus]